MSGFPLKDTTVLAGGANKIKVGANVLFSEWALLIVSAGACLARLDNPRTSLLDRENTATRYGRARIVAPDVRRYNSLRLPCRHRCPRQGDDHVRFEPPLTSTHLTTSDIRSSSRTSRSSHWSDS